MSQDSLEVQLDPRQAYERGQVDFNFFATMCLPTTCVYRLPDFYIACWRLIAIRGVEYSGKILRFALGLPRSHAKTTFVKVLVCWLIVYDKISFPLVVCANTDQAKAILADIQDILSSRTFAIIYGDWQAGLAINSADTKKAIYHKRSVAISARGWEAGIRGINVNNERPDLILLDDAQTMQNASSEADSARFVSEFTRTIVKAIAPTGDRSIIYVGNMYNDTCLLYKLKNMPQWISMITGAITVDGTPLWPELFSIEDLRESFEHDASLNQTAGWFAEVMNDPQMQSRSLLPDPLPISDESEIISHDGAFITIDPAGWKKTSDENVIVAHVKFNSRIYIVESISGIMNPQEVIEAAVKLALKYNACLIGIENAGYQASLAYWMEQYKASNPFNLSHIQIVLLPHKGVSKESRIRTFVEELYRKSYVILDQATRVKFVWQASMYKMGASKNADDLLDACAYGVIARDLYGAYLHNPVRTSEVLEGKCSVVDVATF